MVVPGAIAVKRPVEEPMVAAAVLLLTQLPPAVASFKVVVVPEHKDVRPVMGDNALTVMSMLAIQPVPGKVYVIFTVPAATPVTTPVEDPTVARPLPLVQVPPPASVRVIVWPTHTLEGPEMAPGSGFTVSVRVVLHPVPSV
jgi:hypothetical protein